MKYPGRIIHSIGVAFAGILFFSMIINAILPISDNEQRTIKNTFPKDKTENFEYE